MNNFDSKSSGAFNNAYQKLNLAQREAVDTIEGPVMVIAGPGTGKTQILTLRIANILLKTDTAPDSILALTFTESGVKAMRERLRGYIGATAYRVSIYTFHGFSEKLISQYPDAYDRVIGGRPASDLEKIRVIETILDNKNIKLLRPMSNTGYYVPQILRIIGNLKQEYITPDIFADLIAEQEGELLGIEKIHQKGAHQGKVRGEYTKKEKSLAKNKELLYVYRQYEALLQEQKLYDFEDMIVETVKALNKNEDMLRDLQENYQYILADEHQDVNGSQNKILDLLASFHDEPNIFAVGDEKQAIYRFQGASLENFLYFTKHFPSTKVITLTENYRSGQIILDGAHSLVEVFDGPLKELRVPLTANSTPVSVLDRRIFSHQAIEDSWIVEEVKNELNKGVDASEIAIIVRTNREVEDISAKLRKSGIEVTASADSDILQHPITQSIQSLIESTVNDKSEESLFTLLHGSYWGISKNDLFKVCAARSHERSLWSIVSCEDILEEISVDNIESFKKVTTTLEEARKREVYQAPHRVLEYLIQTSGLLEHVIKNDPIEGVRVVRRIYDEVEELVLRDKLSSLKGVNDSFSTRLSYGLSLNAPYIANNEKSVQVVTAHKSKGLEFEVVLIPHLTDSNWSGLRKKIYFEIPFVGHQSLSLVDVIEDERRLLYVAMTRAKSVLHLSSSEINTGGRELITARLLDDINPSLIKERSTDKESGQFNPIGCLLETTKTQSTDVLFLKKVLTERGLSATAVNNYLRSPWDYFYRNVLRIPEVQAVHMQFGTVVHNTLEYVTRSNSRNKKLPSDTEIKKKFEQELRKLPINTEEYTRLHEKGLEVLFSYISYIANKLPQKTSEEMKLQVYLPTGISDFPEILLTGKLDRIDFDDVGKAVRVIDYKTGKPKSRNVIEGKTKDSDGGYKRQLIFYALLLSLYDDDRFQCREGVISFVESNSSGLIKEESFIITDNEIEELKQTIIRVVTEIINGDFLHQPCDTSKSDYCHLVELLN